jgi:hypothetical protein
MSMRENEGLEPFDAGYNYEADEDIILRLANTKRLSIISDRYEAASEIHALRIKVRHLLVRINSLEAEVARLMEPEDETPCP